MMHCFLALEELNLPIIIHTTSVLWTLFLGGVVEPWLPPGTLLKNVGHYKLRRFMGHLALYWESVSSPQIGSVVSECIEMRWRLLQTMTRAVFFFFLFFFCNGLLIFKTQQTVSTAGFLLIPLHPASMQIVPGRIILLHMFHRPYTHLIS